MDGQWVIEAEDPDEYEATVEAIGLSLSLHRAVLEKRDAARIAQQAASDAALAAALESEEQRLAAAAQRETCARSAADEAMAIGLAHDAKTPCQTRRHHADSHADDHADNHADSHADDDVCMGEAGVDTAHACAHASTQPGSLCGCAEEEDVAIARALHAAELREWALRDAALAATLHEEAQAAERHERERHERERAAAEAAGWGRGRASAAGGAHGGGGRGGGHSGGGGHGAGGGHKSLKRPQHAQFEVGADAHAHGAAHARGGGRAAGRGGSRGGRGSAWQAIGGCSGGSSSHDALVPTTQLNSSAISYAAVAGQESGANSELRPQHAAHAAAPTLHSANAHVIGRSYVPPLETRTAPSRLLLVIDGANVGYQYGEAIGCAGEFYAAGIAIAVAYLARHVPLDRIAVVLNENTRRNRCDQDMENLTARGLICTTPSGRDDDLFTIQLAADANAWILTRDNYANHARWFTPTMRRRRLTFAFARDAFTVPPDELHAFVDDVARAR